MITEAQLKLYERVGGDPDAWSRSSSEANRKVLNDSAWITIEDLLSNLGFVKRGQASPELELRSRALLAEHSENERVSSKLWQLA